MQSKLHIKNILIFFLIVYILYITNVTPVVAVLDRSREFYNLSIEYITHFKDKEPFVFICLPLAVVYLLSRK
jgi:hypothetical protein